MTDKTKLTAIPGIGKTFEKDFARIGIHSVEQLAGGNAEALHAALVAANDAEDHATSKNYLYVIRMCIYYADGGREPAKLTWSAWKDSRKDPR
jgi:Pathogenicity locus